MKSVLRKMHPYRLWERAWISVSLLKARMGGKAFYCAALAGESDYNICINADLTVSCNCQDFDGSGHIGTIEGESLEDVFNGDRARHFRAQLAAGEFPTSVCNRCSDLRLVSRAEACGRQQQFCTPHRGIMIENTALCNLRCALCKRDDLLKIRSKRFLSLSDLTRISAMLKEYKLESIYYFNLGEPFIPNDIGEQVKIIRDLNPNIQIKTSTNGILLDKREKMEAALMMDHIQVSLDGISQKMVERYQVGGDFEKAYRNMANLVALRNERKQRSPEVEWVYVVFRWNDKPEYINAAIELAKAAKIDAIAFYRGATSPSGRSWRFVCHPFYKRLGEKRPDGGRVINFSYE